MLHFLEIGLSLTKRHTIKRGKGKKMPKKSNTIVFKYGTILIRFLNPRKRVKRYEKLVIKNKRSIKQALKTMYMRG